MDRTEMRLDPLTEAWTLFSPGRLQLPTVAPLAGGTRLPDPFLPGRERFAPHTLHEEGDSAGWRVRAVPNRTPIVRVEGDATRHPEGFYDRMDGVGAHEVVVESRGKEALHELPLAAVEQVIATWKVRMLDLMRDGRLRSFTIVKNVGEAAGGTVNHSISQVLALAVVPPLLRKKLEVARAFYRVKKRSIFEDILCEEVRTGSRLVYENNGFALFCPYAARAPFELALYPKRQCPDFHGLSDQERAQLADMLRTGIGKLCAALGSPAYNFSLFTAPTRTAHSGSWGTIEQDFRWHIEILPRLHHFGGVELATGCWVNSVWPEAAADYLRKVEWREA